MKRVILLIFLMLMCATARAESYELHKMELTSDSLAVAISTQIRGEVDNMNVELKLGDRGFRAGLLFAMIVARSRVYGLDPSKYIGYLEIDGNLIFVNPECAEYSDWFLTLPESRQFESVEKGLAHDGVLYWNFILLSPSDIVLESSLTAW